MTKCAKRVSPTDAADWHPARSAADVLGDLRCFGIGHNDIVAADAVRGDGDSARRPRLHVLEFQLLNFASVRPIIPRQYQSRTQWIIPNVIPFLSVTFG